MRQKGHPILAREPGGRSLEAEGRVKVGGFSQECGGAWQGVKAVRGWETVRDRESYSSTQCDIT